jgi:hypothetical protein
VYPGWVVAPEQTRNHLYEHTQHWIVPIVEAASARSPLEALTLLDELNWRLEVALLPLFDNVAEAVEQILRVVHPFSGAPELPAPPQAVMLDGSSIPLRDWEVHRRRWLALSLALLRYYREERHHLRFDELASRLLPRVVFSPTLSARWSYERCLCGLARLDDAFTRQALADWPTEDDDPVWTVRRAAILTELGDVTEAQRLTEAALRRIRSSSHGPAHIAFASREGWAMLLAHALDTSRLLERNSWLPESRGRYDALERLRCNPWSEIGALTERLERDPPRPRPQGERSRGLHLNSILYAYSSGNIGEKLLPAYQYSRFTEEGPFPPVVGRVVHAEKTLGLVSDWLANNDRVRSHSLVCRLLDTELIERYFDRHRYSGPHCLDQKTPRHPI